MVTKATDDLGLRNITDQDKPEMTVSFHWTALLPKSYPSLYVSSPTDNQRNKSANKLCWNAEGVTATWTR